MRFAMNSRLSEATLLLSIICMLQQSTTASEKARQKEMMKIGEDIVSPEVGKLFLNAQQCLDNNKTEQAADLLKQFLTSCPNSTAARYKYGLALMQQGKDSEALEQAKRCTEINAGFFPGWALLGETAMNLKLTKQAINAYQKALSIQSTGENADIIREHLSELTKPEKSSSDDEISAKNQEIIKQNNAVMKTNQALSLCNEANALLKQKQFDQGLLKCQEALKIAPDVAQVKENFAAYLNDYASDCVQQQNLKQAETLIKEAVQLQSSGGVSAATRTTTLRNYSALLKFLGRDSEAREIEAQMKKNTN